MKTAAKKTHGIDMLHGPMAGKMVKFALPLIASGILQQSFNTVDVAVMGYYSTPQAMGGVGSNGMIISILVSLFLGISVGANVVIANYIGQRDKEGVRRSVATVAMLAIVSGVILAAVGSLAARPILEAMDSPADVIDLATAYLRIYFLGMPFIMIYNFGSAILRSIGDTVRPFYALLVASITNIVLDWLFVSPLGMGVDGVALATVIANAVNALIIVLILRRTPDPYKLRLKNLRVSMRDLSKMLKIGVPAGLQGMIFSFSNIFIQAAVNSFGSAAVAATAATLTYETWCYYILSAFCAAAIAFVGQNYGAGNAARCRHAFAISMALGFSFTAAANILVSWQAKACVSLFTTDPAVMEYALVRIHTVVLFQSLAASYEISGAYMRGLGYSLTPMLLTVFGTCVLRLTWVLVLAPRRHDFGYLLSIYPITWIITGIMVVVAAFIVQHKVFGPKAVQTKESV